MSRYSAVRVTEVNHLGVPVPHEPFSRYIPADDPGYMALTVIRDGPRGAIESVQILRYTGDGEIDHSVPEVWVQRHSPRHHLALETWGWEMGGAYTAYGDPQWLRERYPTEPSR